MNTRFLKSLAIVFLMVLSFSQLAVADSRVLDKTEWVNSPILTYEVTVAAAASSGVSTATLALGKGCEVVGIVPTSNQDQLVDSVALAVLAPTVDAITLTDTDPVAITTAADHGLTSGDRVYITSVGGTVELNNKWYSVTVVDGDDLTLDGTDSSQFTTFTTGGTLTSEKGQITVTLGAAATADNVFDVTVFKSKW